MAKFRSNHTKKRGRGNGSSFFRSIFLVFIAFGILFVLYLFLQKNYKGVLSANAVGESYDLPLAGSDSDQRYFLPRGGKGEMVHHTYYSLSYNEKYEQAEWVAYELTKKSLQVKNVKRTDWYSEDPLVRSGSAAYYDYKGSGYTRGHLAPAGDMAFNDIAMEESFLMSNISPQLRSFNNGIWKELEELTRNWAYQNKRLFVVTGPVLNDVPGRRIGKNKVAVPEKFYKVILDLDDPGLKAIAFVIPNELSEKPVMDYAISVDELEAITGLDFYGDMMTSEMEAKIESEFDKGKWPVKNEKFKLRVKVWNKQ